MKSRLMKKFYPRGKGRVGTREKNVQTFKES